MDTLPLSADPQNPVAQMQACALHVHHAAPWRACRQEVCFPQEPDVMSSPRFNMPPASTAVVHLDSSQQLSFVELDPAAVAQAAALPQPAGRVQHHLHNEVILSPSVQSQHLCTSLQCLQQAASLTASTACKLHCSGIRGLNQQHEGTFISARNCGPSNIVCLQ